jgi:predicted GTPase
MKIYIIAGKAKCGKSTFGTYLREELKEFGYKPCVMQITDPLYNYASSNPCRS